MHNTKSIVFGHYNLYFENKVFQGSIINDMIFYQLLQEAELLKFIMKGPHFVDKKSHKGSLTAKSPNAKLRELV